MSDDQHFPSDMQKTYTQAVLKGAQRCEPPKPHEDAYAWFEDGVTSYVFRWSPSYRGWWWRNQWMTPEQMANEGMRYFAAVDMQDIPRLRTATALLREVLDGPVPAHGSLDVYQRIAAFLREDG